MLLRFALARFRVEDQEWDYFAVLLSYLIQSRLTTTWEYISLYDARVPGRAQSPARYEENVQSALTLLGTGKVLRASKIWHLDREVLLDSGTPISLPSLKKLNVDVLRVQSTFAGQTIQSCYNAVGESALEVIAIVRAGEVILLTPDTVLHENDWMIILGSNETRAMGAGHLAR